MTAVEEWVRGKDPIFISSGLMATVGLSVSHWRTITSKKKRWISTGNKLYWLLIDSPSYNRVFYFSKYTYSPKYCLSGSSCSKLMTSLVNVLLKFQMLISRICQYFLLKKM